MRSQSVRTLLFPFSLMLLGSLVFPIRLMLLGSLIFPIRLLFSYLLWGTLLFPFRTDHPCTHEKQKKTRRTWMPHEKPHRIYMELHGLNTTGGDQNIGTFLKLVMARAFSLRGDLFLVSKTRKRIGRGESPRTPPDVCESGAKDSPLPSQTFHRPNIWGGAGGARVASRPDSAGSLRSPENKILNLYQKKL